MTKSFRMANIDERLRIGERIRELRNEAGLTVRGLADLSDVSYQNITKIENGKYNVSIDILSKVTDALNAKIEIIK